jgi:hypothetical protein
MSYTGPHLMTLLGGKKSRQRPTSHGLPFHNVDPSNACFVKSRRRVLYVEDTVGQFPLEISLMLLVELLVEYLKRIAGSEGKHFPCGLPAQDLQVLKLTFIK